MWLSWRACFSPNSKSTKASWDNTKMVVDFSANETEATLVELNPATYNIRMFAESVSGTSNASNVLTVTTGEAGVVCLEPQLPLSTHLLHLFAHMLAPLSPCTPRFTARGFADNRVPRRWSRCKLTQELFKHPIVIQLKCFVMLHVTYICCNVAF